MHEFNLKTIKIGVIIVAISMVVIISSGISILKPSYHWRAQYLFTQLDYLKTEFLFAKYDRGSFMGIFSTNKEESASSDQEATFVPILLYHGVITDPSWEPDEVNVRLSDFKDQMFTLKKAGWQTITIEDYLAFTQGEEKLPAKSFLLTFDDGRTDSYYPVDPILKTLGFNAVMYAITNRLFEDIGEQGHFHLSRVEFSEMIKSGRWQIESHGRDDHDPIAIGPDEQKGHFLSNEMWLEKEKRFENETEYLKRINSDLANSKKDIEKKLGTKVLSFAYPFGDLGETTINFPESKGKVIDSAKQVYPLSMCQAAGGDYPSNYPEGSFLGKRIVANSLIGADEILRIFEKSYAKPLDFTDDFEDNNGWIRGWGTFSIEDGAMLIGNSENDESGLVFLNGSYLWRDFSATAEVSMKGNGKISLTSRYHDAKNYMSCDFFDKGVVLVQKMNQQIVFEKTVDVDTGLASGNKAEIGVRVHNNNISCYYEGKEVVSGEVDSEFQSGGIGFKIYNPTERDNVLSVSQLKVDSLPQK